MTDGNTLKQHKWKRDTAWWDDLEVPDEHTSGSKPFEWLASQAPDPTEHDYVLYTDGSGCSLGWGGYAALWERIELDPETEVRKPVDSGVLVNGTYGSTVQRTEFTALVDGVHKILTQRCSDLHEQAATDEQARYILGTEGALNQFKGPERIRILWYTDRQNIAKCFLFDSEGSPLQDRNKERDLWLRWSALAQYVCITPMHNQRNVIGGQAVCDKLAGLARSQMKEASEQMAKITEEFHPSDTWQKKKPQTAQF